MTDDSHFDNFKLIKLLKHSRKHETNSITNHIAFIVVNTGKGQTLMFSVKNYFFTKLAKCRKIYRFIFTIQCTRGLNCTLNNRSPLAVLNLKIMTLTYSCIKSSKINAFYLADFGSNEHRRITGCGCYVVVRSNNNVLKNQVHWCCFGWWKKRKPTYCKVPTIKNLFVYLRMKQQRAINEYKINRIKKSHNLILSNC